MPRLANGERQVAPDVSGIRRDHVARYELAARMVDGCVLDAACGVGYGSHLMHSAGVVVTGIDKSREAIDYAKDNYSGPNFFAGDVMNALPILEDDSYDWAVSFETIEHLKDPLTFLRELRRLAPNLLASVPNESEFPFTGQAFHHRHYTKDEFNSLLNEAGWSVNDWFGQEGPQSDVHDNPTGRTLIAHCERGPVIEKQKSNAPEHVAILGMGPSCSAYLDMLKSLGGRRAFSDETWGINALGDVFQCDRIFHMDDVMVQEARAERVPSSNIAKMLEWMKTHPGPIYTSVARDGYPGLVPFPLEDVLNGGYDSNGGAPYFNSTAAYAIAYAIHIGVKRISLFGLDYTLPNWHNAEKGRACCEFWLGIAAARGIEITVPEQTSLLDANAPDCERMYGYDCVDVGFDRSQAGIKVTLTDKQTPPDAEAIERRYDHSKHPNRMMT